ncbi:MAG: thiamine pyrophosphate-binding protein [Clostridiaceae bacterium]
MRITIGDYLIARLKELKIKHILGVPGDFNLQFLEQIRATEGIEFVGSANELNGAYAADGYSRSHGISALCITYGVGDLGAIGGVAGSSAEHVPVIVISGAPPLYAMRHNYKVHHSLADGDFSNIAQVYREFTACQVNITPENASFEIDRAILTALRTRKPVNIQLPSNISYLTIETEMKPLAPIKPTSDPERLKSAIEKTAELYKEAKRPAVLVDMDVDRLKLTGILEEWIDKTGVPFAAMSTGKAILSEQHPLYLGTYKGDESDPGVQERIENADFLLCVSPRFIEWNSGQYSVNLPEDKIVRIARDYVLIGDEGFEGIYGKDLMEEILKNLTDKKERVTLEKPKEEPFKSEKNKKLIHKDFWKLIGSFLKEGDMIFGETGTSNYAMMSMRLPRKSTYVGSQIWGAIGFTLPAYFGSMLANPDRRQILFIGDGSFQVTAQEFSTILRHKQNPIIFLINNDGYTIERYIMGMNAEYNDIAPWTYAKLNDVMAKYSLMITFEVSTQGELEEAIKKVEHATEGILIEVHMDPEDAPDALKKFGPTVAKFNFGERGPEQDVPK